MSIVAIKRRKCKEREYKTFLANIGNRSLEMHDLYFVVNLTICSFIFIFLLAPS